MPQPAITLIRDIPPDTVIPGFHILRARVTAPQNFPTDKVFVWQSQARAEPTATRVARLVDLSGLPETSPDTAPGADGLIRSAFRTAEFVTVCRDLAMVQETWDLICADVSQLLSEYALSQGLALSEQRVITPDSLDTPLLAETDAVPDLATDVRLRADANFLYVISPNGVLRARLLKV